MTTQNKNSTPEQSLTAAPSVETQKLVVSQPNKLQELNNLLLSLENLDRKVSEKTGEDRSGDLGAAGASGGKAATSSTSTRDEAIAQIPAPTIMQQKLRKHIKKEMQDLEKMARHVGKSAKPGSAYKQNQIYSRIRQLNALLRQLVEASVEILKRFFIRVFIDKQPII